MLSTEKITMFITELSIFSEHGKAKKSYLTIIFGIISKTEEIIC